MIVDGPGMIMSADPIRMDWHLYILRLPADHAHCDSSVCMHRAPFYNLLLFCFLTSYFSYFCMSRITAYFLSLSLVLTGP